MEYRSLDPGMMRRIRELDSIDTPDGLAIAGDYTTAPTVEGAVRSGERAAQRCLGS
jgi:predicted NAD/FAD-dependent oxidoreductase